MVTAPAWNSAVASGVARMLEPNLRRDLGYFYSEFVGIHDNYDRYNQFTEREGGAFQGRTRSTDRMDSCYRLSCPHGLAERIF